MTSTRSITARCACGLGGRYARLLGRCYANVQYAFEFGVIPNMGCDVTLVAIAGHELIHGQQGELRASGFC